MVTLPYETYCPAVAVTMKEQLSVVGCGGVISVKYLERRSFAIQVSSDDPTTTAPGQVTATEEGAVLLAQVGLMRMLEYTKLVTSCVGIADKSNAGLQERST